MMQMPTAFRSSRTRRMLLFVALLLTLFAVFAVDNHEESVGEPVSVSAGARGESPGAAGATGRSRGATLSVSTQPLAADRALPSGNQNPFGLAAWTPEARQAVEAQDRAKRAASEPTPPPPPPMAPPLPFTFLGRLIDGDRRQVFLNHGQNTLIVGVGETIDQRYRVDRIESDTVHFTYLPLGQQQVLAIPGTPR